MQMRAGRAPGRTHAADDLADADLVADVDVDLRKVAVAGREAFPVIDLDHLAVAAAPAGRRDGAGRRGVDRIADLAAEIEPGMHRRHMQKRIDAHPEGRAEIDIAGDRFAHRDRDERAAELFGLRAGNTDARERALELAALAGQLQRDERTAGRRRRSVVLETEHDEDAAQQAGLAFVAVLHLPERRLLASLDAIERS